MLVADCQLLISDCWLLIDSFRPLTGLLSHVMRYGASAFAIMDCAVQYITAFTHTWVSEAVCNLIQNGSSFTSSDC